MENFIDVYILKTVPKCYLSGIYLAFISTQKNNKEIFRRPRPRSRPNWVTFEERMAARRPDPDPRKIISPIELLDIIVDDAINYLKEQELDYYMSVPFQLSIRDNEQFCD